MTEIYSGEAPDNQGSMYVINDQGQEEYIPPDRTWEWELDARKDAITIEQFEAEQLHQQGEQA